MFRVLLFISYVFISFSSSATQLNNINGMVEDEHKNMYISTHSGVYRFDGNHYLKLSDITELPNTWSKTLEFSRQKNTLYIAYRTEGVWQLNLTTQVAKKISNIYATELALDTTQLLMKSGGEIHAFEVNTQKVSNISAIEGRVLSISAYQDKSYILTTKGSYLLVEDFARLIEEVQIEKGEIQATPDGVVYSRDNVMVFYDYQQEKFRYDDTFKNPLNLTAADAHHIYFVDNNIIKKYSNIGLEAGQYKLGINDEIFNDIYIDKENKIWLLGVTDFHILDTKIKFEPFNFNSKYNVFGLVNNEYWIGTDFGVYHYNKGETSKINWLDQIMPIEDYTVQNIVQF
ncbi:hypothetical protein CJF42_25530, partial [Pseudoalteromonas sp. NBT06-2]|uniref:hypothetical protein n=1 Tax=Pseudoalteromonas sp. NBT06-2 TaxID=2025950 RepID=UPI000BD935A3